MTPTGKGTDSKPLLKLIVLIGLLALIAIGAFSGVAAADPLVLNAKPGELIVIDSNDKPFTPPTLDIKGHITVDRQGKSPSICRLLYIAPSEATEALTEKVPYEKNAVAMEAEIHVAKPAEAQVQTNPLALSDAFKILGIMFVLAVLLEQALSVIFNWRPFLQNFDARGVKTIVSLLTAWFVLSAFDLDLVKDLVNVYVAGNASSSFSTKLLTALILAGGSSGVNNLLISFGFRSVRSATQIAPKPPQSDAWIAVRLLRDKAVGQVVVSIGPSGATQVVGGIAGSSPRNGLLRYFLVDRGRFPMVGGHAITPDSSKQYEVALSGVDSQNNALPVAKWGVYSIAGGAVIDVVLKL